MAVFYAEFDLKASRLALKPKLLEDGTRLGQCVVARVVAERAVAALRLLKRALSRRSAERRLINAAFDDEFGLPWIK